MKKLINDPARIVPEYLEGLQLAYPHLLTVHFDPQWVGRAKPKSPGNVAVISGGGSGHEPLHAGFVGLGMLDAAVPGPVFTAPTPFPIVAATEACDQGAGVLYIVKNYTGDVLNFEVAAEMAEADGITVNTVLVDDDVAVEDSTFTAGRRGIAGTVLVEKIAGAAAERGDDLNAVTKVASEAVRNLRSMGLALGSVSVPHAGIPTFELGEDEIEVGVGIHGEPGSRRGPIDTADTLAEELYRHVAADLDLGEGDRVVVLVNGLGGTPQSELLIFYRRIRQLLDADGVSAERSLVGDFVTSLEMPGVSLSLMKVNDELLQLFDAPTRTAAWPQI